MVRENAIRGQRCKCAPFDRIHGPGGANSSQDEPGLL